MILLVLVLLGAAYYFTTLEERARLVRAVLGGVRYSKDAVDRVRPAPTPFEDALRGRTPRALVTPILVALNATVFVVMLFGAGALGDPETLVGWGANFGPRTTNGEWWRLVTATFVHSGMLHLVADIAGLIVVGLIMERLFGRLAFAAAYLAAGTLASVVSLSARPVTVSVGASGAIFGIYGLFLGSLIAGRLTGSTGAIPVAIVKRFGPAAGVFILYSVAAGFDGAAEIAGFGVGLACGLVLGRGVGERTPPVLRVAVSMGVIVAIAVASAGSLRRVTDVRPELERIVAVEERTASAYETAVHRFRNGQITTDALAQLIDRTILPELQAARDHLKGLAGVPSEHAPLVAAADEYLQLRDESWRVRADGLRTTSEATLRDADRTERASLESLARIRPAGLKADPRTSGS